MAPDPSAPHDVPAENIDSPDSLPSDAPPAEVRRTLDSIASSPEAPDHRIRSLLHFGRERLGVASAHLTNIRPGPGTHTLTHADSSLPAIEEGTTQPLSRTYCRKVVVEGGVLALHDAPAQGWADDPAYRTSALDCYLGTKVVVDGRLVGTVCFGDPSPRSEPFCPDEKALLRHLSHRIGWVLADDETPGAGSAFEAPPGMRRRVQEVSRIGGWELAVDGGGVTWTQEARLILELPRDDGPARPPFRPFFPEAAYASFRAALSDCIEDGTPFERDLPLDTAQGHRRWVRVRGVPQYADGDVCRVTGTLRDITNRRDLQSRLEVLKNQFRRLVEHARPIVFMIDAEGTILVSEGDDLEALGLAPGEHVGASVYDLYADTPEVLSLVDRALDGEKVDTELQIADTTLDVWFAPYRDETGSVAGGIGMATDVTERRRRERTLRRTQERFRNIFNNAALGIALTNEDGAILEANPALERMLGHDAEALAGTHFSSLTHPEDRTADAQLYQELLAGERDQYQLEKRYVRQNGAPFWGRVTMSRQMGPDGPQIVAMIEDIDAQKKQNQTLRLFRRMVEHSQDAIVLTEETASAAADPEIRFVNQAFTAITGYTFDEAAGRTAALLQGPETDRSLLDDMRERMADGDPAEGETIHYRKDGTPFVNHWKVAPIRGPEGQVTHFVSVHRDVTARRRMQSQLLEVREEERRRIDQRIHDEMGGALTSLQMMVDLARMEASSSARQHLDRIEEIISGLSTTARSISRKLYPSSLSETGLSRGLSLLVEKMETQHDLNIDLHFALPGKDASSLIQRTVYWIVHEALLNVARHAETDRAAVRVRSTRDALCLEIVDPGQGFDLLSSREDDSNLGLDGIRRRVEHLEGALEIDTAPGEGTHLSVTLPLTIMSVPS